MTVEGDAAPESRFLSDGGREIASSALLDAGGGLPTLVAFFKTTCPTCRLTWPYLQRLHDLYGGRGVRVVGVSQNDADSSRRFYEQYGGATFDLLFDPEPAFAASNAWGVEAVPHLALVDPDRRVRRVRTGWSRKEMEELGRSIAEARNLPVTTVVPPDDPVKDFQAG